MSVQARAVAGRIGALAVGLALAGALGAAAPAAAQVAAAPLSQVDPWGMGKVGGADALAPDLWANSDAAVLAKLMDDLQPRSLSPAARRALARMLMSPTRPPQGGHDAQPARLGLLERLGETDFALELRRISPGAEWGQDAERLTAYHELATLRANTACRRAAERPAGDPSWLSARALCLALAGDYDTAALAAEQTLTQDRAQEPWLLAAIETMRQPARARPAGRYGSAFEIAVSLSAGLGVPRGALDALPPDLAQAVANHPSASPDQKRAAVSSLLAAGRLTEADLRAAMGEGPPAPPASGASPAQALLAQARVAAANSGMGDAAHATAFAAALKSAANAGEFQLAALTLAPYLRELPRSEETGLHAETFTRAGVALGDTALALRWREELTRADADPWVRARLDYMLSLSGVTGVDSPRVLADLAAGLAPAEAALATTPSRTGRPAQTTTQTTAQTQADLRRIEATRILFLHAGLGRPTPPALRALIGSQRAVGRGVSDAGLLRADAALEAGARGEAALTAISLLTADPSAQSFAGLADLLKVLRTAGLAREADALALESLQVWKAF
jgi:hypothetical protein